MKIKILLIVFAVIMGCSVYTSGNDVYAKEIEETDVADKKPIFYETEIITQKDYEEGFQNYALSDATVDLKENTYTLSDIDLTNVVGVVKDFDTEEFISGATILINGESIVSTGDDGRFQIKNLPSGIYDWEIYTSGYCTAYYNNYDVDSADGTTIFTFYMDDEVSIYKDREEIINAKQVEVMPLNVTDLVITRTLNSIPSVKNDILVLYNNKKIEKQREEYIYTVVSSELYGTSYYEGKGLTAAQISELFEAQAVAANTHLEYALSVYSKHSEDECAVCSEPCCQKYDPTKVTQAAINATVKIFYTSSGKAKTEIIMYKPTSTTYEYVYGTFFSSCYNKGTKDYGTSEPTLKAVSCTDIATGYGGHRYGLCQMGAATRAKNGNSAADILLHYYTNGKIIPCTLK